jgi:hypothetical protein
LRSIQYLGASIYNVSVLICFLVPIVSSQVGSRSTTFQIHAYGVMIIVISTMAILFVPKIFQLRGVGGRAVVTLDQQKTQATHTAGSALSSAGDEGLSPQLATNVTTVTRATGNAKKPAFGAKEGVAPPSSGSHARIPSSTPGNHSPQPPSAAAGDDLRRQLIAAHAELEELRRRVHGAQPQPSVTVVTPVDVAEGALPQLPGTTEEEQGGQTTIHIQ